MTAPCVALASLHTAAAAQQDEFVARLNRGVREEARRVQSLGAQAFGSSLTLHRFALGNGLQVRIVPDRSAPVISYHTWFRVGSRHETPSKTGLAHLLEHLMFNETKRLPYGEFDRIIEAAGGESNASTWTDFTQYHVELPAVELAAIVDMEAQRMSELQLRDAQVDSEKEVVANERRYRVDDDVEGIAAELLYATAFRRHSYRFPTIGLMDDIAGLTTADCERFYRTYYAPNNATLVIVGDAELEATMALIQERYGSLRASQLPAEVALSEAGQGAERVQVLKRATPAAKLLLGYHAPAIGDPDHTALSVISDLLFAGRGSRLYRELVRKRELVSDLSGSVAPFRDPGLFEMWFSLRGSATVDQALPVVDEAIAGLQREPVSADELERAANRYELGFLHSLETASGKADQIGFHETVLGNTASMFERLAAYRQTTPQQIMDAANRYLRPAHRTRITVLPSGEPE